MIGSKAYQKRQAKARQRRRLTAQERLARDRRQAQQAAQVLEQALHDLGIPYNLVIEIEGRLRSQQKLLSKIVCAVKAQSRNVETPRDIQVPREPLELSVAGHLAT